jgi:hypothetical protein
VTINGARSLEQTHQQHVAGQQTSWARERAS